MKLGDVAGEPLYHPARCHVEGGVDGAGEARGVGPTVAFDDDAVKPKKYAAIQLARIQLFLESAEGALRQEGTGASKQRPPHGGAQILADLLSGSFGGLQGDVAGEAVGDHHVDHAVANGVALDETMIIDGKGRILQRCRRLLDFPQALDLLDPDIEEPDRG